MGRPTTRSNSLELYDVKKIQFAAINICLIQTKEAVGQLCKVKIINMTILVDPHTSLRTDII